MDRRAHGTKKNTLDGGGVKKVLSLPLSLPLVLKWSGTNGWCKKKEALNASLSLSLFLSEERRRRRGSTFFLSLFEVGSLVAAAAVAARTTLAVARTERERNYRLYGARSQVVSREALSRSLTAAADREVCECVREERERERSSLSSAAFHATVEV